MKIEYRDGLVFTEMKNIPLDFTGFKYDDINGLLGLDILIKAGSNIFKKKSFRQNMPMMHTTLQ